LVKAEDLVRDVTKRILKRAGYKVLIAVNGNEALNLYAKENDKISLVILDLIMPEMGGQECLEKLREIDPDAKIVITSGQARSSGPGRAESRGVPIPLFGLVVSRNGQPGSRL
jgi:CheY-like chemotaxis protein